MYVKIKKIVLLKLSREEPFMVVGRAYTQMLTYMKEAGAHYLPYLLLMLILGHGEFYFMSFGDEMIMTALFFSLAGIIIQVSFFYSLNYKYGLEKGDMSFFESLWSGLCFTPGYILEMIKLLLRIFVGLCLLIVPGIYLGLKHALDPYYTLVNSDGSPYKNEFSKQDLKQVALLIMPFACLMGLLFPPWGRFMNIQYLDYLQTSLVTILSLVGLVTIFFYINLLEQKRTKSC